MNDNINELFAINSPVGILQISIEDGQLNRIRFDTDFDVKQPQSQCGKLVRQQIDAYFADAKFQFDLPLFRLGSEHQLKVWSALSEISTGNVMTYGELAKELNSSARAIGNACRNNPLPIVVPCHRIVAAKDIGGFSGSTQGRLLSIKRNLLCHEGLSY